MTPSEKTKQEKAFERLAKIIEPNWKSASQEIQEGI